MSGRRVGVLLAIVLLTACAGDDGGKSGGTTSGRPTAPYRVEIDDASREAAAAASVDVEQVVRATADAAFALLPHRGQITIRVGVDGNPVIPEVGIGGFADPRTGDITISIGDTPGEVSEGDRFAVWVPLTVAHEAHHSSRIRTGPGYGRTLGEAIVTEGLADHFARELLPDAPTPPWTRALTPEERVEVWRTAEPDLWRPLYDHPAWFFGTGDLPRWSGYSLGFEAVAQFLDADGRPPSELVDIFAKDVLDEYAPSPGS